jgi:TetR/AcrR family transcriptional regulator, repressor for neighboring sulfatase
MLTIVPFPLLSRLTITLTLARVTLKKRARRSPEEAKTLILDAADRVFARALPDTVGLQTVAKEAGVSHALVTHYFGTYDALVESALERRFHRIRDEIAPVMIGLVAEGADARQMLRVHRSAIRRLASEPATVRLAVWAVLSGRAGAADFFPHRMQGLKLLADALSARSTAEREDLEFLLVVSFAITSAWASAGPAFAGALGRKPSAALDDAFERRTDALVDAFLRRAERLSKDR